MWSSVSARGYGKFISFDDKTHCNEQIIEQTKEPRNVRRELFLKQQLISVVKRNQAR